VPRDGISGSGAAISEDPYVGNDVLIIGAGPSGLFAAAELVRHGTPVRLIEREMRPHHEARATTIQAGTLEILDSVGLLAAFLENSEHVCSSRIYASDLSELRVTHYSGVDCRCQFQCVLPQYETQRILEEHLVSVGGAVERGVTATSLESSGSGLRVELSHADGRIEEIQPEVVIGAGGAHSLTRGSMSELLEGATYQGHFLVADIAMKPPLPRDQSSIVCGPDGLLLLSPMRGGRWISFLDLEETVQSLSAEQVAERVAVRLGHRCRPSDVAWFSPFRMQRRIAARLTDGRRFLIGDAAHLSSAFGGEGLNSGLHDAFDLAWKLSLVLRGDGRRSMLDDYAVERSIADQHVLAVSDQVHGGIVSIAQAVRARQEVPAAVSDPLQDALVRNARAMIDVDYAGSPLVAACGGGASDPAPHPGQRYPDWTRFGGATHHLLVFGAVSGAESLAQLSERRSRCLRVHSDPDVDSTRAGIAAGGMVLVRPDGHIDFKALSVDAAALAALDAHLSSYLV
jgi:2-polyprenyl-6-methoxyphenol hydroxylase-like FAD-dependent oxidoreductase